MIYRAAKSGKLYFADPTVVTLVSAGSDDGLPVPCVLYFDVEGRHFTRPAYEFFGKVGPNYRFQLIDDRKLDDPTERGIADILIKRHTRK